MVHQVMSLTTTLLLNMKTENRWVWSNRDIFIGKSVNYNFIDQSKLSYIIDRLINIFNLIKENHRSLGLNSSYARNETSRSVKKRSTEESQTYSGPNRHELPEICKCRKRNFNVNFYDIGWGKWIIYPKVYNAHRCIGDCSLPSMSKYIGRRRRTSKKSAYNDDLKVTNHAQIMSILEFRHPEQNDQQMSKCVSTRLKPLTVIFLDERGRIKTKQYEDMVVEECGCR
jgi:hypothetical protein